MAKLYRLRYSPLFYDDLSKIVDYILSELKNEAAAISLIDGTEEAIRGRLANPLTTATYQSVAERQNPYRRIIIGNYLIFYVVIEDTMIVRRILYGRRDLDKIL
jgi:addiction module RelE/StbE family toxin